MATKKNGVPGLPYALKLAPLPPSARDVQAVRPQPVPTVAPSLDGIAITVETASEITEAQMLQRFLEVRREASPRVQRSKGDPVALGDDVELTAIAMHAGSVVPFSFRYQHTIELTPLPHLPGFAESIAGQPVGERLYVGVMPPADYPAPKLRNKKLDYIIELNAASEVRLLPNEGKELLKALNRGSTIDSVMESIHTELIDQAAAMAAFEAQQRVLDEVLKRSDLKIPPADVDKEITFHWQRAEGDAMWKMELEPSVIEDARKGWVDMPSVRADAERRLKLASVLQAIVDRDGLTTTPEQLLAELEDLSPGFDREDVVEALNQNLQLTDTILTTAMHVIAVDYVVKKAKVTFVPKSKDSQR